jgi:hypothetical protein
MDRTSREVALWLRGLSPRASGDAELLFELLRFEANEHLPIDHDGGGPLGPHANQLLKGRAVLADVLLGVGDLVSRQKLYRPVTGGSAGLVIKHDTSWHQGLQFFWGAS